MAEENSYDYEVMAKDRSLAFEFLDAVTRSGMKKADIIFGFDFTKKNILRDHYQGNLHCRVDTDMVNGSENPYESAISFVGHLFSNRDILSFGFGDASTRDQDVFSFYRDGRYNCGVGEVLRRYQQIVPGIQFAGPTSLAPVIDMAMNIVQMTSRNTILFIIATDQVNRRADIGGGMVSRLEQQTIDAIVRASKFRLTIILLGVGDWPLDMKKRFDDIIPPRRFDNFRFVDFTRIMLLPDFGLRQLQFSVSASLHIRPPSLHYHFGGEFLGLVALPPPESCGKPDASNPNYRLIPSLQSSDDTDIDYYDYSGSEPCSSSYSVGSDELRLVDPLPATKADPQQVVCIICMVCVADVVFSCGHKTCSNCDIGIKICPTCRAKIRSRHKLMK